MTFIPDQPDKSLQAPYFEDVSSKEGWAGFTTTKGINTLISEVTTALGRLGGIVTGIQSGTFLDEKARKRLGYVVDYFYKTPDGRQMAGKIEVSGLPMRSPTDAKEKKVRQMVLYMLRDTLDGYWYMQQLSPGFMALMPFMLADNGQTFSQKFMHGLTLPAPQDNDIVDGEIFEAKK
jgi:hypothetical protein